MRGRPATATCLVVDRPIAVYSGMVPGLVAGHYPPQALEIDVVPLARAAGVRVVMAAATAVDPSGRRVELEGRPPEPYDVVSFDVGSTVAGLDVPGVRRFAVPTRPIGRFVERVEARLASAGAPSVVVVGGGAGGVELAFALRRRLGPGPDVRLVHRGKRLLDGLHPRVGRRAEALAAAAGIGLELGAEVAEVDAEGVRLTDGRRVDGALVVWVTGAVSHGLFAGSGLPLDARGFLEVGPQLHVDTDDRVFAAGDCATLRDHPRTPKAGVYAVRQGPVLARNLEARLAGRPLERYQPQSDFLTLLNLGDGRALGTKWGASFEGPWVMRLKDRIDRAFMARFQVLDAEARPGPALPPMPDMDEVPCGGCAAKLGETALRAALSALPPAPARADVVLGLASPDDAAAFRTDGGELVLATVDAFRAFTDDPYLVGRVAALNAASDVLAKGGQPRHALALVTVPEGPSGGPSLGAVLRGVRDALDPMGVALIGGHTTTGPELVVGLTVLGRAAGPLLTLDRARPGDLLVLTKPLGTGVLLYADMRGRARGPWMQAAFAAMTRDGTAAARIAVDHGARAMTDVTGFGLAGHALSLLAASGTGAQLALDRLPALAGAVELLRAGLRSTAHAENARARRGISVPPELEDRAELELLFDPQTAGGFLVALPAERAEAALEAWRAEGVPAVAVGRIVEPPVALAVAATLEGLPG